MYPRSGEYRATQPRGLLFLPTSHGQTSSASVSHHEGPASTHWPLDMSTVSFLVAVYPLLPRALVDAAIPPSTTPITHSSTRARHIQNHDFVVHRLHRLALGFCAEAHTSGRTTGVQITPPYTDSAHFSSCCLASCMGCLSVLRRSYHQQQKDIWTPRILARMLVCRTTCPAQTVRA